MIKSTVKTDLRRFTPEGVAEFRRQVDLARLNKTKINLDGLLDSAGMTQVIVGQKVLGDPPNFERYEFCKFLHGIFATHQIDISNAKVNLLVDGGLWSWLAARWSSTLTSVKGGKPFVGESSRWIFESQNGRRDYRHLLASPYRIYSQNVGLKDGLNLVLAGPVWLYNEFFEQVASRKYLQSNPEALRALEILYWDPKKKGAKDGARAAVDRFGIVFNQLELTWDLGGMKADEIVKLLPDEFKIWTS
jgi:hypothetical protein